MRKLQIRSGESSKPRWFDYLHPLPSATRLNLQAICAAGRLTARVNASGRAKLLSFTIVRRPVSPAFADQVPYVVALVTLEEGPQMMTNIVGCAPEDVTIGMPLEVTFEDWSETISIPKFRPRR